MLYFISLLSILTIAIVFIAYDVFMIYYSLAVDIFATTQLCLLTNKLLSSLSKNQLIYICKQWST